MLSSQNSSPQKLRSGHLPFCSSDENLSPRKYTTAHPHSRFSSASLPSASQESISNTINKDEDNNNEYSLWDPNATSISNTKSYNQQKESTNTNSTSKPNGSSLLGTWFSGSWSSTSVGSNGGGSSSISSGISAFAISSYSKISASISSMTFSQTTNPEKGNSTDHEREGGLVCRAKAGMAAISDKVLNNHRKKD